MAEANNTDKYKIVQLNGNRLPDYEIRRLLRDGEQPSSRDTFRAKIKARQMRHGRAANRPNTNTLPVADLSLEYRLVKLNEGIPRAAQEPPEYRLESVSRGRKVEYRLVPVIKSPESARLDSPDELPLYHIMPLPDIPERPSSADAAEMTRLRQMILRERAEERISRNRITQTREERRSIEEMITLQRASRDELRQLMRFWEDQSQRMVQYLREDRTPSPELLDPQMYFGPRWTS